MTLSVGAREVLGLVNVRGRMSGVVSMGSERLERVLSAWAARGV